MEALCILYVNGAQRVICIKNANFYSLLLLHKYEIFEWVWFNLSAWPSPQLLGPMAAAIWVLTNTAGKIPFSSL